MDVLDVLHLLYSLDVLDLLDVLDVLHLLYPPDVLHILRSPHHSQQRTQGGGRFSARPLVLLAPPQAALVVVCGEVNEKDAVHQVDKVLSLIHI